MRRITFCVVLAVLATAFPAGAEPLIVAFNQRPPYHYVESASPEIPKGIVADIAVKVLADTGLKIRYEEMSASRILAEVKARRPFCSLGWFKTPERERYAKFSKGLVQDAPFVVVARREYEKRLEAHPTLRSVFSDPDLLFGTRAGMSYGDSIDALVKNAKLRVLAPTNTQINMIKMMDRGRFQFLILVPAEIGAAFQSAGVDFSKYVVLEYPDIPMGNWRRIMCSQDVPDEIMRRIDASIDRVAAAP